MALRDVARERLHLALLRDVEHRRVRDRAIVQQRDRVFEARCVAVGEREGVAVAGEGDGEGAPDPRRGAGDDGYGHARRSILVRKGCGAWRARLGCPAMSARPWPGS